MLLVCVLGCADPEVTPSPWLSSDRPYGVATTVSGLSATGFNSHVLAAISKFGNASYLWKGDGVTRTISYRGSVIAKPYQANVCHCVGATFQVYMDAFEAWTRANKGDGTLKGLSVSQARSFRSVWYVASGGTEGSKAALSTYKLGTPVTSQSAAQPGDFVQIWRNNGSGHSVIFSSWKRTGGTISGLTYWSCNSGGPGFATETIGSGSRDITPGKIHIGHPLSPGAPLKPDAGPKPDTRPRPDTAAPRPDTARTKEDTGTVTPKKDTGASPIPDRAGSRRDHGGNPATTSMQLQGGCSMGVRRSGGRWGLAWLVLLAVLWRRRRRGQA